MRTKNAVLNIITAFILQVVTIICGFILPRTILNAYGSDTNGLISSAGQFLSYIALLETGLGGVTKAALYRPLSEKNTESISGIIKATEIFYRKIALVLIGYTICLSFIFPYITESEKDTPFIMGVVPVVAISTFIQYYFGITYTILLGADQKNYICNATGIIQVILNTVISIFLIRLGFGIHIVKLITSVVYIVRPIIFGIYVKKSYKLNLKCDPDNSAVKNRWSGFGQSVAGYLHESTDIAVLTVFKNIKEVSVYSVYSLITKGLKSFVGVMTNGLEAGFGNLIAKEENENLNKTFSIYEMLISITAITLFMTALPLFIPFISIYTAGVTDINYTRPVLTVAMVASELVFSFRIPYYDVTLAAGHYRQTQLMAFVEAGMNIVLSIVLVIPFGIEGIVFATLVSTLIRFVYLAYYSSKNILKRKFSDFLRRISVNILIIGCISVLDRILPSVPVTDYYSFVIEGIILVVCNFLSAAVINAVFYMDDFRGLLYKIMRLLQKSKK